MWKPEYFADVNDEDLFDRAIKDPHYSSYRRGYPDHSRSQLRDQQERYIIKQNKATGIIAL